MSKPLGQTNNRFMFGAGRYPAPNSEPPHMVNSIGTMNNLQTNAYQPAPPHQVQYAHQVRPSNLPPNVHIQMHTAVSNPTNNNVHYQQRSNNLTPNISGQMVYPHHLQYPYMAGSTVYPHPQNPQLVYLINSQPHTQQYQQQRLPPQQTAQILPASSQPPMPSSLPPHSLASLPSHMYTQTSSYGPPGPTQHQPAPGPAPQPPGGPPGKAPHPQRKKNIIPILDPKTKRNILEDMDQQQMSQPPQQREQTQPTSMPHQNQDGGNMSSHHSEHHHPHHHHPQQPPPPPQHQHHPPSHHNEELSHANVPSYERKDLVAHEPPGMMHEHQRPHMTHMMVQQQQHQHHHHQHQQQQVHLLHHSLSHHSPPVPQQILPRPHHSGGNHNHNHLTHSPPARPSSNPSPGVQTYLANDNIESLSNHLHSQAHVNSIPTVSALSTGPEVDLADLNQKASSIIKNKHKANVVVPNSNALPSSDDISHPHSVPSHPAHIVHTSNNSPLLPNVSPSETNTASPPPPPPTSYPVHSNSTDPTYPKQSKFFPGAVDTPAFIDAMMTPQNPYQRNEDGEAYVNRASAVAPTQPPMPSISQPTIVLKRSDNASKFFNVNNSSSQPSVNEGPSLSSQAANEGSNNQSTEQFYPSSNNQTQSTSESQHPEESDSSSHERREKSPSGSVHSGPVDQIPLPPTAPVQLPASVESPPAAPAQTRSPTPEPTVSPSPVETPLSVVENTPEPEEDKEILAEVEDVLPPAPPSVAAQTQTVLPKLKHNYQEDQWSPINQEGVKKYSRDFLLELQYEAMSKPKPANLPDLEIVLKDLSKPSYPNKNSNISHNIMPHGSRNNDILFPHYANKPGNMRQNIRQQQPVLKARSIQGGKVPKPAPKSPNIVLSISLKDDIKLRESENAWRPNNNCDEDEKFYKQVRGVLNKLTPENFESMKMQFKEFPINTTKRLDKVIDLVFQKAIAEPSFSEFYAKMCYEMMKREVVDETKPVNKDGKRPSVNFKNLLLNKCQKEFEKNEFEERKNDIKLDEIEAEQDPEKKKELRLMFEEEERLIRKRSVGNCRFIGELYKLNMLTTKIMHHCISELLKKTEEEPLERACKLLSTIGKDLESHDKDPTQMKGYFTTMEELASKKNSHAISSRVRFMLQDVIDLRKNKWIPRRNENKPKTIQQIQYEAESEKFGNVNKKPLLDKPYSLEKPMLDNDRKSAFQQQQKDWNKPNNPIYKASYQFDKTKFVSIRDTPMDIKLGPSNKNVWNQGSNINKQSDSMWTNKGSDSNSFNPSFNSDIRTNKTNSSYKPYYKSSSAATTPTENRYALLHNNNTMITPSGVSTKSDPPSMRRQLRKEMSEADRTLLEKKLSEKRNCCKLYFDEYFYNDDFTDLLSSKDKKDISSVDLCYFAFEIGTQSSDEDYHRNIGNLINRLYSNGVTKVVISPVIEVDVISFTDLKTPTKCLKTESIDHRLPLVKELLKIIGYNKAPTWLQKRWNVGGLKLSDFISKSESVANEYPFFFLTNMEKADLSTVIKVNRKDDLKTRIKDVIISHEHNPCDAVSLCTDLVNWTKGNFGSTKELSASYYHALTRQLNRNDFPKYIFVYKLLELSEDQEIEVLNSVFNLVQTLEFPKGLLLDCFQCLHQEGAISLAAFKVWSNSDQSDGRGVALKQLNTFYQMLNEQDPEVEV
ncbi:hypothetical protein M8J76_005002 [Diaphorina citri]|nr:hypothetical protein M8J76_005002 [Diaphorina citri]